MALDPPPPPPPLPEEGEGEKDGLAKEPVFVPPENFIFLPFIHFC